jgi:lipopolysaccharide/colanic/teichoic acid biosynthesis glycosyltransferase
MYPFLKRCLDVVLSALALLVFLPFGLLIALVLKCTGEGDVFYRQQRVGRGGRPFGLFKFVTMRRDSESTGRITVKGDARVFPVGRVLRKTKLNEVPQVLNILFGDLSIVGWRPLPSEVFGYYPSEVQATLARVKPGLTGIGSVFFRDEESMLADIPKGDVPAFYRANITPYKGALECWYAAHASLWVDGLLVFLTAWAILFPGTRLPERLLRGIPEPPASLRALRDRARA